jgi:hypothetical protein
MDTVEPVDTLSATSVVVRTVVLGRVVQNCWQRLAALRGGLGESVVRGPVPMAPMCSGTTMLPERYVSERGSPGGLPSYLPVSDEIRASSLPGASPMALAVVTDPARV